MGARKAESLLVISGRDLGGASGMAGSAVSDASCAMPVERAC